MSIRRSVFDTALEGSRWTPTLWVLKGCANGEGWDNGELISPRALQRCSREDSPAALRKEAGNTRHTALRPFPSCTWITLRAVSIVGDLQVGQFGASQAGAIQRHEQDALDGVCAASMRRVTSSWLRIEGSRSTFFG